MQRSEGRIVLYFIKQPEKDRFFKGDVFIRAIIRRLIRGKPRPGGVEKVFISLCKGLDNLGVKYFVNLPFNDLEPNDRVAILGAGKNCLNGYNQPNKILAGIGLMTHPSEWPNLCEQYPVVKYLQHSEWAANVYKPYYGERCGIWAVGIDTEKWKPDESINKSLDVLVYNKIRWDKERVNTELRMPILNYLKANNYSYQEIVYGSYSESNYFKLLQQSKSMIFLCEHESQGIACCEALSMNVPVLAWDNGFCLDPNRFEWGETEIPATSVPVFSESCGEKFVSFDDFNLSAGVFFEKVNRNEYSPRNFILENITLEKSAQKFLHFLESIT